MPGRRGRRIALASLLLGLAVLGAAAFAGRDWILESWWLWRFDAGGEEERRIAAEKLGELRSARAVPRLIEMLPLEDRVSTKRSASIAGPEVPGRRQDYEVAFRSLVQIGRPAVQGLLDARRSGTIQRLDLIIRACEQIGPEAAVAVPELGRFLSQEGWEIRRAAAAALARMGPGAAGALPALVRAVRDEDAEVRASAIEALRGIGPAAIAALIGMFEEDDARGRLRAVEALGEIGRGIPEVEGALRAALEDPDPAVRRAAARALSAR